MSPREQLQTIHRKIARIAVSDDKRDLADAILSLAAVVESLLPEEEALSIIESPPRPKSSPTPAPAPGSSAS